MHCVFYSSVLSLLNLFYFRPLSYFLTSFKVLFLDVFLLVLMHFKCNFNSFWCNLYAPVKHFDLPSVWIVLYTWTCLALGHTCPLGYCGALGWSWTVALVWLWIRQLTGNVKIEENTLKHTHTLRLLLSLWLLTPPPLPLLTLLFRCASVLPCRYWCAWAHFYLC